MELLRPGGRSEPYGNPLACAAIESSVGIIVDENLSNRAQVLGKRFRLSALAERSPCVRNVRGEGLSLGFDLTMAHAPRVRIHPPLVITAEQVDELLALFADAFDEVSA